MNGMANIVEAGLICHCCEYYMTCSISPGPSSAVFNATEIRVRHTPILPEDLQT